MSKKIHVLYFLGNKVSGCVHSEGNKSIELQMVKQRINSEAGGVQPMIAKHAGRNGKIAHLYQCRLVHIRLL